VSAALVAGYAHVVGMVMLVGSAVLFDLRVLGLSKAIPVRALGRHLLPWSLLALLLVVPSGVALYAARAGELMSDRAFAVKMGLLLAAATNAAIFHTGPYRNAASWDTGVAAPLAARACAVASIATWLAVLAAGRILAHASKG